MDDELLWKTVDMIGQRCGLDFREDLLAMWKRRLKEHALAAGSDDVGDEIAASGFLDEMRRRLNLAR